MFSASDALYPPVLDLFPHAIGDGIEEPGRGTIFTPVSQSVGWWDMPVMPSSTCKQKIVRAFFQKRAIDTVKTVATEIHPPESTEIQSIYVAFQTGAHKRAFSVAVATENFSSVQSFSD